MMRKNPRVQHVRIGQNQTAPLPRDLARIAWRIPIEGDRAMLQPRLREHAPKRIFLVATQRFGRVEKERPRIGITA